MNPRDTIILVLFLLGICLIILMACWASHMGAQVGLFVRAREAERAEEVELA